MESRHQQGVGSVDRDRLLKALFPDGRPQAPHLAVTVLSRGLLDRVTTRIYFADEEEANAVDPVLAAVPAERRGTLLARPTAEGYHLDIHIQGPDETVFFAV